MTLLIYFTKEVFMLKKKLKLEHLLEELTLAKSNLTQEQNIYNELEEKYSIAYQEFINAKHIYETALQNYNKNCNSESANEESFARRQYSQAADRLNEITDSFNVAKKRVKKATKAYNKLNNIVEEKSANQPGL